jgi:hypothetical protein
MLTLCVHAEGHVDHLVANDALFLDLDAQGVEEHHHVPAAQRPRLPLDHFSRDGIVRHCSRSSAQGAPMPAVALRSVTQRGFSSLGS